MTRRIRSLPAHWLGILVATVFWCLLWGSFTASDVLGGLCAAILLHLVFPLPPLSREIALHPIPFVWFVVKFLWDMTVSGVQVAWWAIRPAPPPPASVIAVTMSSRSDLFLTFVAALSTLIPGSVVVEAQRSTGTLFLHVIGVGDEQEVDAAADRVRAQERRVLRAVARRDVLEEVGLR
jgi:multicomponent Na+:H+ antiporter subunit E